MEASYGVGVANRYALLMDDDEPASSAPHGKGGKENKDNTSKGKVAPGKATAATGAPSNKHQQAQAASKNASAANNVGNKAAQPGNKQQNQRNTGKGGKADHVGGSNTNNNNSIHAVNNNQVTQGKSPRNQPPAALNDAAKVVGSEDQRQPRVDHRGQARDRPPRQDRPRQYNADSHGNGPQKDLDEARKNRRNREDRGPLQPASNFTGETNVEGNGEGRGGNRAPRNPKFFKGDRPPRTGGPRGPRPFGSDNRDGRGKPVFDRHSGSDKAGIKPVEKRDGGGAHNWGTITDDIEGQVASDEARTEKTAADESNDQGEAQNDAEPEPVSKEAEEESREMTLDEYRKQLGNKKNQPKFKLRKPGEGEDNAQWKKTYLLKKDEDEEIEEIEEIEVLKEETRHNKKKVIDIDIRFNSTFRGGDERGRRGGGPRSGGRPGGPDERRKRTQPSNGGNSGGGGSGSFSSRKQAAPKVDDINDFPSLGVAA